MTPPTNPPPNTGPSPWTTNTTPGTRKVLGLGRAAAMFLDLENLVYGAGTGDGSGLDEAALAGLCRGLGTPNRVRRAYANWSDHRLHRYESVLARNGVDLVHCGSLTRAAKNAADIRLVVDAMHILHTFPDIDTYVLATGDSDFSPLVNHLREHGKIVIGVGARTTASPHGPPAPRSPSPNTPAPTSPSPSPPATPTWQLTPPPRPMRGTRCKESRRQQGTRATSSDPSGVSDRTSDARRAEPAQRPSGPPRSRSAAPHRSLAGP